MSNAANVQTGADGIASVGPVGTTAPTDATTSLDAGFVSVGFVSEEGLVGALSTDSTEIKNWKGTTVKKVQTSSEITFKLKFLEITRKTIELYTGGRFGAANVLGIDGPVRDPRAWVFDVLDPTNVWLRIYAPNAEITERDDWDMSNANAGLGVTMTAYPGTGGEKALQLIVPAGIASA